MVMPILMNENESLTGQITTGKRQWLMYACGPTRIDPSSSVLSGRPSAVMEANQVTLSPPVFSFRHQPDGALALFASASRSSRLSRPGQRRPDDARLPRPCLSLYQVVLLVTTEIAIATCTPPKEEVMFISSKTTRAPADASSFVEALLLSDSPSRRGRLPLPAGTVDSRVKLTLPVSVTPSSCRFNDRCSEKGCIYPSARQGLGRCLYHERQRAEPSLFHSQQPSLLVLTKAMFGVAADEPEDSRQRDRRRLADLRQILLEEAA